MAFLLAKAACCVGALLLLLPSGAQANAFLRQHEAGVAQRMSRGVVQQALQSELSALADVARIQSLEQELASTFEALPKNELGKLEPSAVRYALHRYFVQKHGWYVKGLEPDDHEQAWKSSSPTEILKETVPSYVQGLFEERLRSEGMGLHELAVLAATLSDLFYREAVLILEDLFQAHGLSASSTIDQSTLDRVISGYLVVYILGDSTKGITAQSLSAKTDEVKEVYDNFDNMQMWASDIVRAIQFGDKSRMNPFVERGFAFGRVVAIMQEIGHRFGGFANLECHALKGALLDMEQQDTGRVLLADFYQHGMKADVLFTESADYLRSIGALEDEADPRRPRLIIPNYVNSRTNCLLNTSFYSVCCLDACEGLMGHLERAIAAPSASPAHIVQVVSNLHSETVDAPRNVSALQLQRLEHIAQIHGGEVPLHGRLFAQWMHHEYPRECQFPHPAGTTTQLSQEQWELKMGREDQSALATDEEKHKLISEAQRDARAGASEPQAVPWFHIEDLVAEARQPRSAPRDAWSSLRPLAVFALLASSVLGLAGAADFASPKQDRHSHSV